MYCTKCGNKLSNNDKYCMECGCENKEYNSVKVNNNSNDSLFLVLSIIAFVMFWMPIVSIPVAIVAMIKGKNSSNRGVSMALGVISIVLSGIFIVMVGGALLAFIMAYEDSDVIENKWDEVKDNYFDYDYDDTSFDIKGYSWEGSDKSVLYLNQDMSYTWYLDDTNHDDNFTSGIYQVYMGYEALRYISDDLAEYGITEDEQERLFNEGDYDIEDYYLIILNCTRVYMDGSLKEEAVSKTPYYGFYDDDRKGLSLVNMNTGNTANFSLKDRINSTNGNNSL